MTRKSKQWNETKHNKPAGRLCPACGEDRPISKTLKDENTGQYALMDDAERSLLHIYACSANLTDEDIDYNRRLWAQNQFLFSQEGKRLYDKTGEWQSSDDVINSLRSQKKWHEKAELRKHSQKVKELVEGWEGISDNMTLFDKRDVDNMIQACDDFANQWSNAMEIMARTLTPYFERMIEARNKFPVPVKKEKSS